MELSRALVGLVLVSIAAGPWLYARRAGKAPQRRRQSHLLSPGKMPAVLGSFIVVGSAFFLALAFVLVRSQGELKRDDVRAVLIFTGVMGGMAAYGASLVIRSCRLRATFSNIGVVVSRTLGRTTRIRWSTIEKVDYFLGTLVLVGGRRKVRVPMLLVGSDALLAKVQTRLREAMWAEAVAKVRRDRRSMMRGKPF